MSSPSGGAATPNRWRQGASTDPRHERIADTVPALAATAIWLLDEAGL